MRGPELAHFTRNSFQCAEAVEMMRRNKTLLSIVFAHNAWSSLGHIFPEIAAGLGEIVETGDATPLDRVHKQCVVLSGPHFTRNSVQCADTVEMMRRENTSQYRVCTQCLVLIGPHFSRNSCRVGRDS